MENENDRKHLTKPVKMKATSKALFVNQHPWLAMRKYDDLTGLELLMHQNQLRHACGFALVDQGADTRLIHDFLDTANPPHRHLHGD